MSVLLKILQSANALNNPSVFMLLPKTLFVFFNLLPNQFFLEFLLIYVCKTDVVHLNEKRLHISRG